MQHQTSDIKKIMLFLIIFAITLNSSTGQNLVPNPSFEEYDTCPNDYFILPVGWYSCSGTPDYFNECDSTNLFSTPINSFGFQIPSSGRAYIGLYALSTYLPNNHIYKEYIGCQLSNPISIGVKYFLSFRICYSGFSSNMAINKIGLLLSTKEYEDTLPYDTIWGIPKTNFCHIFNSNVVLDSINWTIIQGSFVADSTYSNLLIGNFFDISTIDTVLFNSGSFFNSSYYYIDDVCVSEDSTDCFLTTYIKEKSKEKDFNIYPNPVTTELTVTSLLNENFDVEIRNFHGAEILSKQFFCNTADIKMEYFPEGIYFLRILTKKEVFSKKIILIKK